MSLGLTSKLPSATSKSTSGGGGNDLAKSENGRLQDQSINPSTETTPSLEASSVDGPRDAMTETSQIRETLNAQASPSKMWSWSSMRSPDGETSNPKAEIRRDSLQPAAPEDPGILEQSSFLPADEPADVGRLKVHGGAEHKNDSEQLEGGEPIRNSSTVATENRKSWSWSLSTQPQGDDEKKKESDTNSATVGNEMLAEPLTEPKAEATRRLSLVGSSEESSVVTKESDYALDSGPDELARLAQAGGSSSEQKASAASAVWGYLSWSKPAKQVETETDISSILEDFEKGVESLQSSGVEGSDLNTQISGDGGDELRSKEDQEHLADHEAEGAVIGEVNGGGNHSPSEDPRNDAKEADETPSSNAAANHTV